MGVHCGMMGALFEVMGTYIQFMDTYIEVQISACGCLFYSPSVWKFRSNDFEIWKVPRIPRRWNKWSNEDL
uniref:Uncharacterized protein n=1 Tax=Caenorhabditis japonica TaxID=281687 RepID=A0A8R1I836_CAEJA